MRKLIERLRKVTERIGGLNAAIWRAFRMWKVQDRLAKRQRARVRKYREKADDARARATSFQETEPAKARYWLRKAANYDRVVARSRGRAEKHRAKAQWWVGRIKDLKTRKLAVVRTQEQIEREIQKLRDQGVKFDVAGNRVTGGTPKQRWIGAALLSAKRCAQGLRPNFYSQPGSWTVKALFTGEAYGFRSDCSQWLTSLAYSCGLDDPNGTSWGWGYTGTLAGAGGRWRQVDRATFDRVGWGYCVYGTGTGFHVEAGIGGTRTIGHGDAAINEGHLEMFGDRRYFIYEGN